MSEPEVLYSGHTMVGTPRRLVKYPDSARANWEMERSRLVGGGWEPDTSRTNPLATADELVLARQLAARDGQLRVLREAARAYREAVNAYERAHVRYETANVELRQMAREAMFEANRAVATADATLATLLAEDGIDPHADTSGPDMNDGPAAPTPTCGHCGGPDGSYEHVEQCQGLAEGEEVTP